MLLIRQSMLLLFVLLFVVTGKSIASSSEYIAAVLQHTHVKGNTTVLAEKFANLKIFGDYLVIAKSQGAQILVTPEVGIGHHEVSRAKNAEFGEHITNDIPSNPCETNDPNSPITNAASCMAKNMSMDFVIGTIDLQPCTEPHQDCPSDNRFVYNTALAFNASGYLVAKYHKYHLYLR